MRLSEDGGWEDEVLRSFPIGMTHSPEAKADGERTEQSSRTNSFQDSNRPTKCPPSKHSQRKWPIIISLAYANFWMAAAVSLQAPFFPREAELKGATPTQYGLVFGVFELVVIIMSPIFGKLIPTISPKFLITTGVLIGGAACCIFGVLDYAPAGRMYISLCFVVRIFEGLGAAALMTSSFTIVAAAFPDAVATSFSLMETAFGFGLIAGPTIGGALFEIGGFLLPFVVNGSFLLLGCILLFFLLPNIVDTNKQEGSRDLLRFLADGGILSYTFSIVSALLFIGFNAATLEPHLRKFNLSAVVLGVIFIITGGIYAITTPIWGRMIDKGVSPTLINVLGYLFTCGGIIFIGPMPFFTFEESVGSVVGSLVVIGLGLAAKLVSSFVGALQNTSERGFPDNLSTYSMVSALFSTACSLGAFVGPSLGGFLLENIGYKMGTVVIFSMDAFFFLLLILYGCGRLLRRKRADQEERAPILREETQRKTYT